MDQRRIVVFVALSFVVLMLNSMFLAPPPVPNKELKAGQENPQGEIDQAVVADEKRSVDAAVAEKAVEEDSPLVVAADVLPQQQVDVEYLTLGSVDKDSPYRLLVTFTNQGAGVRRIELASPRFRDLHDRGGYLGHLELAADPAGGLRVGVVGAGTPAADAGLRPGDRLVAAIVEEGSVSLGSPSELLELLAKLHPDDPLVLEVVRESGESVRVEATLARRPLEVIRPESENVLMRAGELLPNFPEPPSFQFTFDRLGADKIEKQADEIAGVELRESNWEIAEHDTRSVTFRQLLPERRLEVLKRYHLESVPDDKIADINYPGYSLKLDIEVRNLGEDRLDFAYRLDGPNGLPIESWWFAHKISRNWGAGGLRDVVARYVGNKAVEFSPTKIAEGGLDPLQGPPLAFIGVDAQYFSVMLLPIKPSLDDIWIDESRMVLLGPKPKPRSSEGRYANVTTRLISHVNSLDGGSKFVHSYEIFAGPKRPDLLAHYHASESKQYTLGDLMYYGWFGGVAKFMLGILHFFFGVFGNYGIAIILLTVLVKSCMFPVSRKQAQSMAKMQELRPEMDKLKEKFKTNKQKQSLAMQELYRKHKINRLAGCLPMFIQLPIFIGLYRSLMVDVELRQASLLGDSIRWCSNLAAPDMLFDWSAIMPDFINRGEGLFGLGPYLNVLPMFAVFLFLLQQKLFMPEPANEQAAMQQKMMKYMMLFMGLFFYKFASGLSLYFIASSIWGIAERKMLGSSSTTTTGDLAGEALADKSGSSPRSSKNGQTSSNRSKKKKAKKRR